MQWAWSWLRAGWDREKDEGRAVRVNKGLKEGWAVYHQRGGSSGCSPLGFRLLSAGCMEMEFRIIEAAAQFVFIWNIPRNFLHSEARHVSEVRPTQWLLIFAPRCKKTGTTERRSMKLGLKGSRLRLRMCASAGLVLASSSTPAFEDIGIANRCTPHYTYTPVAGLSFPVSFLFLLTFLLPLHHVLLCFPAQVSRLGSWIICLHLFSF